jgi:hypothetical protein
VYLLAGAIPVSLAATNVAKLLALLFCLAIVAAAMVQRRPLPSLRWPLERAADPADAGPADAQPGVDIGPHR